MKKIQGNISIPLAIRIAGRSLKSLMAHKPLCIALEVTHSCVANCRHCDKGGHVDEVMVGAEEYKRMCDELNPTLVQIAGGEPLLRKDLPDIVRALHTPNKPPALILVTNAALLNMEKYRELKDAGMYQFSISLDFPDERHDDFRQIPGLFARLNKLIPEILALGNDDVVVNCCITRANYPYIKDIIGKVSGWGAKLNFSAYTDLRTNDYQFNLQHPEDTSKLNSIIDEIYHSGNGLRNSVMTSERVLRRFVKFFENGNRMPNCRTGDKFLIVNPDGRLTPCAMFFDERYDSLKELKEKFANKSDCDGCYISIRANTEKSMWELLTDNLRFLNSR
ncbi:MAG: radical SAM protein [candidate division Zixibacteria bacterium]|nr:radical SAM protein [candidate division Zixibacteria bacterium]